MIEETVTIMDEGGQIVADDENSGVDWPAAKKDGQIENVFYEEVQQKPRGPTTRKQQKYRKAWEFYPEFSQWLEPDETSCYKAKCKMCNKVMVADISVLKLHATGKKHIRICEDFNKAKATLESINTSQPGRANLPTTRKLIRMGQQKLAQRENSSDLSFENLSIAGSQKKLISVLKTKQ